MNDTAQVQPDPCSHRYMTSHGRGWECAECGVGILSLALPLPLPLFFKALEAITTKATGTTHD